MTPTEALELLSRIQQEGAKVIDPGDVAVALEAACNHYFETRKNVSMKGVGGAPDWTGYESATWQLSEAVRHYLKVRRDLRGRNVLLDRVSSIVSSEKSGKGRQNFVLILGEFGNQEYAPALKKLVLDPEVGGHAIKALTRLKADGCAETISAVLKSTTVGWIRTAAKEYLKRYPT